MISGSAIFDTRFESEVFPQDKRVRPLKAELFISSRKRRHRDAKTLHDREVELLLMNARVTGDVNRTEVFLDLS
jgi:hypothetical protein